MSISLQDKPPYPERTSFVRMEKTLEVKLRNLQVVSQRKTCSIANNCLESFIALCYITLMNKNLSKYGIVPSDILIPGKSIDKNKWAVIACDQFTQDKQYWQKLAENIAQSPSTLNLVFPEVFLEETDADARIKNIHAHMQCYYQNNIFTSVYGMIYLERKTAYNRTRCGLITAIDLECYDWNSKTKSLIRATEATIIERLPPRMKIRTGALLELPHIMLLVNDAEQIFIEQIAQQVTRANPLYCTDLVENSGNICGWLVDETCCQKMEAALNKLYTQNTTANGETFLFAVGDGNHSLATAKAVWEEYKKSHPNKDHPLRYALVEIVNLFDAGLTFEPIHRVFFHAEPQELLDFLESKLKLHIEKALSKHALTQKMHNAKAAFSFSYCKQKAEHHYFIETDIEQLLVSTLQPLFDEFLQKNPATTIDYIHGSNEVFRLALQENTAGILLPQIAKTSFFATIAQTGNLPRKSFSMGEASEKRFYYECRKIL